MRRVPCPPYKELMALTKSPVRAAVYFKQGYTWEHYLKMARSVANCVAVLHGKGCAHGDVHFRNFLVDITTGNAVMLELDGVIIEGFMRSEVKGLPGFMAPEVIMEGVSPNLRTDYHSLAVLVLYTLLFRNVMEPQIEYSTDQYDSIELGFGHHAVFSEHPKDARNRPANLNRPLYDHGALSYKILSPRLQRLTEQALIMCLHTPEKRPSSKEWADTLALMLDEIVECRHCCNRFPYPYWVKPPEACRCPFCGGSEPARPLVLKLYEEGRRYEYRSLDRALALEPGAPLFQDMTQSKAQIPLLEEERAAIGRVEWNAQKRCYRLINEKDSTWTVRSVQGGSRKSVRCGEAVSIEAGTCIQFGSGQRLGVAIRSAGPTGA
jgi:serine/threonine protein kinase